MARVVDFKVRTSIAVAVCLSTTLFACDDHGSHHLASIEQVRPEVLEPGEVFRIEGSGFVEGQATIAFTGEFKPVGMARAQKRTVLVDGVATSNTEIELAVTPHVMRLLASSPSHFKGNLEVGFPGVGSFGAVRIQAKSEQVSIDLMPAGGAVEAAASRSREASEFLAGLGIMRGASEELVVHEVADGSPAWRAGLRKSERLLAIDGVALTSLQDLAGVKNRSNYRFSVASSNGAVREISVAASPNAQLDRDELAAVVLFAVAAGLFFAFAAPTRRRMEVLRASPVSPVGMAIELGVAILPGPLQDINHRFINAFRLSYGSVAPDQILEGIELLADAVRELFKTSPGDSGLSGLGDFQHILSV